MEELLRLVIEDIKAHSENFNMSFWVTRTNEQSVFPSIDNPHPCGTACCIAGRIAVITGATIEPPTPMLRIGVTGNKAWVVIDANGSRHMIEEYAADKLGFSMYEREKLFYTSAWPGEYYDMAECVGEAEAAIKLMESVIEKGRIWW